MVLVGAEVERLLALSEVNRSKITMGTTPHEAGIGSGSGVGPTERSGGGGDRGVALGTGEDAAELPGLRPLLLHLQVAESTGGFDVEFDDRAHEDVVVGLARVEIHHVGLRVLGHTDDEARKGGATGTGCVVRDDDRPINNDTSGDVDQQRPIHEGVVQEGEVVAGVVGDRTETGLTVLVLGQGTNVDALIDERFIDLHEHHAAVHTADQRSRLDVEPGIGASPNSCAGA